MARNRPEPTLADYMAIAIGPALIIVLVSSIAFFLLTVFYAGSFAGVTQWTMGCFVVAAVLISRVSINEGAERAAMFGAVLMVVVGIAMVKYTDKPWIAWMVLGVIWAFASHLVWNCTLIDDAEDASGEGLLEAAGLEGNEDADAAEAGATTTKKEQPKPKQFPSKRDALAAPPPPPPPPLPAWRRLAAWWQRGSSRTAPPGIWVIYCSLVALPMFGIGQLFLTSESRPYAFQLMFRYVAAALLLLLTTSFLGLRRYLRQRKLEMPLPMAGVWLGVGGAMVAAILLLALLIPRPNPDFKLASLAGWITSPSRQASRIAPLKKSAGEGESESSTSADEKSKAEDPEGKQQRGDSEKTSPEGDRKSTGKTPGENEQPTKQSNEKSNEKGKQSGGGEKGEPGKQPGASADGKQSSGGGGESKSKDGQAGEQKSQGKQTGEQGEQQKSQQPESKQEQTPEQPQAQAQKEKDKAQQKKEELEKQRQKQQKQETTQPGKPPPQKPATPKSSWTPSFSWLGSLLKFLFYLAAAIAVMYLLYRYRAEVRAWLARLWQEVLDIWNSLFGAKRKEEALAAAAAEEVKAQPRPFASFKDPFQSGDAARNKPSAVVQYSFDALEAWARERGLGREPEETPLEFANRLSTATTALGTDAADLASLYARVAYARDPLSPASLTNVERLWKTLRKMPAPTAVGNSP